MAFKNANETVERLMAANKYEHLIQTYLGCCYEYYHDNKKTQLLDKDDFENMCAFLDERWDVLRVDLRRWLKREDLTARTCTLVWHDADATRKPGEHYPKNVMEMVVGFTRLASTRKGYFTYDFGSD